jgi:hypothetical protein
VSFDMGEGRSMNDNSAPSNADHYRALADDAYAASERLSGDAQRIMRQIAVSYRRLAIMAEKYHRLAAIADTEERSASISAPSMGDPEAGVA